MPELTLNPLPKSTENKQTPGLVYMRKKEIETDREREKGRREKRKKYYK